MGIEVMPEIEDIKQARELGFGGNGSQKYIWLACVDCGRKRWVFTGNIKQARYTGLCKSCRQKGRRNNIWKGGRAYSGGYIKILLSPDDFFYPMTGKAGYELEHRLVVAKALCRCLNPWEIVHHKNGIKDDNRIENLEVQTKGAHITEHGKGYRDGYIKGLHDSRLKQIQQLKKQIREIEEILKKKGV